MASPMPPPVDAAVEAWHWPGPHCRACTKVFHTLRAHRRLLLDAAADAERALIHRRALVASGGAVEKAANR